jgi:predicted acyl esterase
MSPFSCRVVLRPLAISRALLVLSVCALAAAPAVAAATGADSFLPESAGFVATETRIPMRDGATLAADVYLPRTAAATSWPVVLIQTPYDRKAMRPWFTGEGRFGEGSLFTDTAYAFVVTDWRGRFESAEAARPGRVQPGGAEDGYDTVEWVAAQTWSNGKVGTWGPSALGAAQFRTASARPPHLVCAVPVVMPLNLTYDVYFPGGVLWDEFARTLGRLGWDLHAQLVANPVSGTPFWKRLESTSHLRPESLDLPLLLVGGWFDIYVDPVIETFARLRAEGGPRTREHSRLVVGPWLHRTDDEEVGILRFPGARGGGIDRARSFFDRWLRGIEDAEEAARPAITYYAMRPSPARGPWEGAWREAASWPPAGARDRRLYLDPAADALTGAPPVAASSDALRYDPADPLPTPGGHVLTPTLPSGPQDLAATEARSDVAVFTTPPLDADLEIAGRPRLELWVASDRTDSDVVAFLAHVDPEGRSTLLGEGVRRLRFRESTARETLLQPGAVVRVEVDLTSLAMTFPRGHRLRVVVSSSNHPKHAKNLNDGGPMYREGEGLVATNQIHGGGDRPSALVLPALPAP